MNVNNTVSGGVIMSADPSTIVAGLGAKINIILSGQIIPNGTAAVYLDVDNIQVAETPVVNNAATMYLAAAPAIGTLPFLEDTLTLLP